MFGILLSAFYAVLSWLLRSIVVKFVLYFGLWFITTEFIQILAPLLPGASNLTNAFTQQSSGIWYFLDLFKIPFGISACLSAYVLRFSIRRLPVIG